jgi:hypothetical protein
MKQFLANRYTLIFTFFLFFSFPNISFAEFTEFTSKTYPEGGVDLYWYYSGLVDHYEVYQSEDYQTYSIIGTTTTQSFKRQGLNTGTTYYFYVVAISGGVEVARSRIIRATPPFQVTLISQPLSVEDITDTTVTLEWGDLNRKIFDGWIWENGVQKHYVPEEVTSMTIDKLDPNTKYEFWYVDKNGVSTNHVIVQTKSWDTYFSRLEELLSRLFLPSTLDSDADGIPDWQEPIYHLNDQIRNNTPLGSAISIGEEMTNINKYYDSTVTTNTNTSMVDTNGDGIDETITIAFDSNGNSVLEVPSLLDGLNQLPLWLKKILDTAKDLLRWIMWASLFIYLFSRFMPRTTL